ncbi:ACHA3-like protein [Mya arenaria]|uniref:ACHA3-like protein n=1 Tax=Mya arenaria TaxID=6604 RepID=A0ABY7FTI8_MYAAR|nr:ACHA3-like protein [Mya arenaria]
MEIIKWIVFVTLHSLRIRIAVATGNTSLHSILLEDYEPDARPCGHCTSPLAISVSFYMTSLLDLDELAGTMVTMGYVKLIWVDERLTWRPQDHGGVSSIFVASKRVWVPSITLGNPSLKVTDLNKDMCPVRVLYNGTIIWMPGDVFHTRCDYDIYNYPFDHQYCYLAFVAWPYLANEVMLVIQDKEIYLPFYQENGEWSLVNTSTRNRVELSMSISEFNVHLSRRSEFFVVNVILPIVLLCFLDCLVFLIPLDSGERISYSITVLLSFAVFMTLVSDNIPKTSAPMSLLCYYLFLLFAGSVLVMINVAVNISLLYREQSKPIPGILRKVVILSRKSKIDNIEKRNTKKDETMKEVDVVGEDVNGDHAIELPESSKVVFPDDLRKAKSKSALDGRGLKNVCAER